MTDRAAGYVPPQMICRHGRQTVHCAECAPDAEAKYRAWRAASDPVSPEAARCERGHDARDAQLGAAIREALPTLPPWARAMLRAALTPEVDP